MIESETPIEMTERHVRKGEEHVASQERIIRGMDRKRFPAEAAAAEDLLTTLHSTQALHEAHLRRLRASI